MSLYSEITQQNIDFNVFEQLHIQRFTADEILQTIKGYFNLPRKKVIAELVSILSILQMRFKLVLENSSSIKREDIPPCVLENFGLSAPTSPPDQAHQIVKRPNGAF
jgi:hypothetical protein